MYTYFDVMPYVGIHMLIHNYLYVYIRICKTLQSNAKAYLQVYRNIILKTCNLHYAQTHTVKLYTIYIIYIYILIHIYIIFNLYIYILCVHVYRDRNIRYGCGSTPWYKYPGEHPQKS